MIRWMKNQVQNPAAWQLEQVVELPTDSIMAGKQDLKKQYQEQLVSRQLWIGEIVQPSDATRRGFIKVRIDDITKGDLSDEALFDCLWTSPFAGATETSASTDPDDPAGSQTSYGMWMRPPDVGNQVIVGIIYDNSKQIPVILSCLYQNFRNTMVPGIPSTPNSSGTPAPGNEVNINQDLTAEEHNLEYTAKGSKKEVKGANRPRNSLADALFYQGLGKDWVRGQSTSGARRDDNSEVFGILTPGAKKATNPAARMPGHQFVMDDNPGENLIRLRTGQGAQLLLNDTHDIIYIINKAGTGYVEIDGEGNIDIFGKGSFNVRTMGDLNLRADQNVNIEAGQDINIKAANNAPHPYDIGRALGGIVDNPDDALDMLVNPLAGDFQSVNNKGSVNIEGFKDVKVKSQNIKLNAEPKLGSGGELVLKSALDTRMVNARLINKSVGSVGAKPIQPLIHFDSGAGFTQIFGGLINVSASGQGSPGLLNLEADNIVNIKPPVSTPRDPLLMVDSPFMKASDVISMKTKKLTLFGFNMLPVPLPLESDPDKQVQGQMPTGLGKDTDGNPLTPPIPVHEGMSNGGVNTIVSRMPQPEPSISKKDKPFGDS